MFKPKQHWHVISLPLTFHNSCRPPIEKLPYRWRRGVFFELREAEGRRIINHNCAQIYITSQITIILTIYYNIHVIPVATIWENKSQSQCRDCCPCAPTGTVRPRGQCPMPWSALPSCIQLTVRTAKFRFLYGPTLRNRLPSALHG